MSANGFTADTANPRQAGRVTFVVSNTDRENEHDFQILKLSRGFTLGQAIALGDRVFSDGPPDLAAIRSFNRAFHWLGGVNAPPGSGETSMTLTLTRGTYVLADTAGAKPSASPFRELQVVGRTQRTAVPRTSATVTATRNDRFSISGHLPSTGSILVRNRGDEPHFVVLEPVRADATDAQIQAVFDRAKAGDESAFRDFPGRDGPFTGTGVVGPGYQIIFSYSLPAGKYAVSCFWPSVHDGMPHAFHGMHKVVSIG